MRKKILSLILSFLHLFSFPNHPLTGNVSVGLPPLPYKFDANISMKNNLRGKDDVVLVFIEPLLILLHSEK